MECSSINKEEANSLILKAVDSHASKFLPCYPLNAKLMHDPNELIRIGGSNLYMKAVIVCPKTYESLSDCFDKGPLAAYNIRYDNDKKEAIVMILPYSTLGKRNCNNTG